MPATQALSAMVIHADLHPQICAAIRERRRLHFLYDGVARVVEPYCHGRSGKGSELLRAVQVGPERAGKLGVGKLWTVAKLQDVTVGETFEANDPDYNPVDPAMQFMHCWVERD
jgi:hypothetical protein